jgi:methylenetetrahydrofolate reductase (NADPH)
MRNKGWFGRPDKATMVRLLENARFEVLPTASIVDQVVEALPPGSTVTVTASPTKGLEDTLATSEKLVEGGFEVVPHLAARMVSGRTELEEIVARLRGRGVTRVFVPGGDAEAVGDYADALALLEDLVALDRPFQHVGVTGYPEAHPTISDDMTIQAMWDKRRYATHVVSNLTFDPALVAHWVHRLRLRGITMPLLVGVPGPIDRAKLFAMATRIGIGDSTKFLAKHTGLMARLTAPGGFTGERFLEQVSRPLGEPIAGVEGLHVYTFNQVAATETWRTELISRLRD